MIPLPVAIPPEGGETDTVSSTSSSSRNENDVISIEKDVAAAKNEKNYKKVA